MKTTLIVGMRGSPMARMQTNLVLQALHKEMPTLEIVTKIISVKGDRDKQTPIPSDTIGKVWFTEEIENALKSRNIDLAVHSLKDVPPEIAQGTIVLPVLKRADPRDALISKDGSNLTNLPSSAIIGTDSSRRKAQLLALRPDLQVESIRGNADSRLRKLREEQHYDAIVLAAAGLARLDLLNVVTEFFDTKTFVPAPGQGVLAVQTCDDNTGLIAILRRIQDPDTVAAVMTERAFTDTVGGGCKSPIGAYAMIEEGILTLYGMIADEDGSNIMWDNMRGSSDKAVALGEELAQRMLQNRDSTHA